MRPHQAIVGAVRSLSGFEFPYSRRAAEKRVRCKSGPLSCQRRQNGPHLPRPAGKSGQKRGFRPFGCSRNAARHILAPLPCEAASNPTDGTRLPTTNTPGRDVQERRPRRPTR